MPLFECSNCHVAENTALSNYWTAVSLENKPALCSQCDPEIGVWHGKFPRTPASELRSKNPRDFIDNKVK